MGSYLIVHIMKFGLYVIVGIILGFIPLAVLVILENVLYKVTDELSIYSLYGLVASLIYYHIYLLLIEYKIVDYAGQRDNLPSVRRQGMTTLGW